MNRGMLIGAAAAGMLVVGAGAGIASRGELAPVAQSDGPMIASVAFMAGQWQGPMDDGIAEEHWSKPQGNNVMGMFRWLKADGTPVMFEILTITEESGSVFLRLRHFNAKLGAREEKDEPMTLKLAEATATKAVFRGVETEKRLAACIYEKNGSDELKITVEFPDPTRQPLHFTLTREGSGPPK